MEGDFSFGLYDDTILKFGLRSGDSLKDEKINEIMEFDEYNFGKKIAYSYLSYRQRSKSELVKKLKQKKISDPVINKITRLLEDQKYLNDQTYAESFLENKINTKPIGKRLAIIKLYEKGINKEIAEKVIEENYSEDKEIELATIVLKKYEKIIKYKDEANKKSKCYRYLISRGFGYEIVSKVLNVKD